MPLYVVLAGEDAWSTFFDQANTALNDGFILDQVGINATGALNTNCSPNSATSFFSTGDQTTWFTPGRRVRVIDAGGTSFSSVLSASYSTSTTQTTVTVTGFTGSITALTTSSLTSVAVSPVFNSTSGAHNVYRPPAGAPSRLFGL